MISTAGIIIIGDEKSRAYTSARGIVEIAKNTQIPVIDKIITRANMILGYTGLSDFKSPVLAMRKRAIGTAINEVKKMI